MTDAWLRLAHAALCLDCEAVYELERLQCPACGSGSAAALAGFLDNKVKTMVLSAFRHAFEADNYGRCRRCDAVAAHAVHTRPVGSSDLHAFEAFPSHNLCCRRCGKPSGSPVHL